MDFAEDYINIVPVVVKNIKKTPIKETIQRTNISINQTFTAISHRKKKEKQPKIEI